VPLQIDDAFAESTIAHESRIQGTGDRGQGFQSFPVPCSLHPVPLSPDFALQPQTVLAVVRQQKRSHRGAVFK
jgi:hypothetical protein